MREKKIKQYFTIIDYGIKVFNANKGFKVDASEYSDWLVFDKRILSLTKNGLNYTISITPNFDNEEKLISWALGGSVWYDTETDRYLSELFLATEVSLEYIAFNTRKLLTETYDYISAIKKEDIPQAVEFRRYNLSFACYSEIQ